MLLSLIFKGKRHSAAFEETITSDVNNPQGYLQIIIKKKRCQKTRSINDKEEESDPTLEITPLK